jgi:nitric oxide reductase NorE protein
MVETRSERSVNPSIPVDIGAAEQRPGFRVPAESGIWVLIFGDLLAFAAFFAVFMEARGNNPSMFAESSSRLHIAYALVNTILLLTSSFLVARAVRSFRGRENEGENRLVPRLLVLAATCGLGFVGNKAWEYSEEISAGVTPSTNLFDTFFYTMTGVHLLHLIVGLIGLGVMWAISRRAVMKPKDLLVIEIGASYWHLVDVLWLVIFPLLYLVR